MASFKYSFPYSYCSSKYRNSDSCRSFSLLKAISKSIPLLFATAFKIEKEQQLKAITIRRAIQKGTHELMYKTNTKMKQRGQERQLFLLRDNYMVVITIWGAIEKFNITIEILEK